MKRLILVILAAFWIAPLFAQINLVEYFLNSDPGFGKGTPVGMTNGDLVERDFDIPLNLPSGFHTVGLRARTVDGKWSQTILRTFFVNNEPGTAIQEIEYFIDNDPGIGKGAEIPTTVGENGYVSVNIPLNEISEGFHLLGVRTKDNLSRWSQTALKLFFNKKGNLPSHIVRLEYFFTGEGAPETAFTYDLPELSSLVDLDWVVNLSTLPANRTYTINVTAIDENGLKSSPMTAEFFIRPPILIEDVEVTNLACFGVNTGKAIINATGVGMTLEYSIDDKTYQAGNTFENLAPGDYVAYVRDKDDPANKVQLPFSVTSPTELSVAFSSIVAPTCVENSDGTVTINATGGTAPYTYKLASQASFQSSNILTGLPAGESEIIVKDANGCEKSGTVTIDPPAEIVVTFTALKQPDCPGDANGGFTVVASGGAAGYEYKLSSQATFQSSAEFGDLEAGTYTVSVKDSNGCEKTGTVEIAAQNAAPPVPTITLEGRDGIDAAVNLVSSTAASYQWLRNGTEIPGATNQKLPVSEPGNYQVRITNAGGCQAISTTTTITSNPEVSTLNPKSYPNPTDGVVIIDLGKEVQIDRVTVVSTTGIVMKVNAERMLTDKVTLDFAAYQSGMYIVQVEGIGLFERIKIHRK